MTYRLRNIGIAIALAVIAALLVTFYVSNYRRNVQQGEETVKVWVAAKDIPADTPGSEVVEGSFLKQVDVARRSVAPGAISDPGQIEELVAADPIYVGEQVTARRFTRPEEKGVRSQITGNLRAFQVPGDSHQLLAGTLKAGDRVDVVASITFKVKEPSADGTSPGTEVERVASRVVLRDLLVLKAASLSPAAGKITNPQNQLLSVTLAITDSQAQKLFFVLKNGDWSLQLRPTDDPADSPESVETVESVLGDGLKVEQLEQLVSGFTGGSFDGAR
jgi:Flp pilus assembly protein CpaB